LEAYLREGEAQPLVGVVEQLERREHQVVEILVEERGHGSAVMPVVQPAVVPVQLSGRNMDGTTRRGHGGGTTVTTTVSPSLCLPLCRRSSHPKNTISLSASATALVITAWKRSSMGELAAYCSTTNVASRPPKTHVPEEKRFCVSSSSRYMRSSPSSSMRRPTRISGSEQHSLAYLNSRVALTVSERGARWSRLPQFGTGLCGCWNALQSNRAERPKPSDAVESSRLLT
jgi:hypothetical protein